MFPLFRNSKEELTRLQFTRYLQSQTNKTKPKPYNFSKTFPAVTQRGRKRRQIHTLDPTKLALKEQRICDLSGVTRPRFQIQTLGGSLFRFYTGGSQSFPPNSRGVLYYNVDPHLPPISGAIRFRLCDSVEGFDEGKDLILRSTRRPWELPLVRMVHTDGHQTMVQRLLEEELVQEELISDIQKLPVGRFDCTGQSLFELSQPFLLNLEMADLTFHLVTRTSFKIVHLGNPSFHSNPTYRQYSGLANVRLELSTLPEHEEQGPTLMLRFLDFPVPPQRLTPEGSGPFIVQQNGSLLMRKTSSGHIKPWTYPLNSRKKGDHWNEFLVHLGK